MSHRILGIIIIRKQLIISSTDTNMAQADATVVSHLRRRIMNIFQHPRGYRKVSDFAVMLMELVKYTEERKFYQIVADLFDELLFNAANNYFDEGMPFQLGEVLLAGSLSEGMQTINFEKKQHSDLDLLLVLKNIKISEEDQARRNLDVKEDTAFANLFLTDEDLMNTWSDFLETSNERGSETKICISSLKLKKRFRENYIKYGPLIVPFSKEEVERAGEGASVAVSSALPGNWEADVNWLNTFPVDSFDFVLAIKCEGWPLCAQEWITRPRIWPTHEIVEKIINDGFHIVCKSSSEGDFQLSFSNADNVLIQNLNVIQYKVYRAFKALVTHYKGEWNIGTKNIITSFHLKTIVLWYCEKSDPKEWNEDTLVFHFLSLIDELILALKEQTLPMYFMPKYNLMKDMEGGPDVAEKLQKIRFNLPLITDAIVSEEPNVLDWTKFVGSALQSSGVMDLLKFNLKGEIGANVALDMLQIVKDSVDEFWIRSSGEIPQRNNTEGNRAMRILIEQVMKLLAK